MPRTTAPPPDAMTTDLAVERRPPSSSVGAYLEAVWAADDAGCARATTKEVAARLSVSPASVTNMFARLRADGLVEYERYRGASLTCRGREEALRLVRRRRLIETFLVERLGYSWREVQEERRRKGPFLSERFAERLAEFLGHPERDPHGRPIPGADGGPARET